MTSYGVARPRSLRVSGENRENGKPVTPPDPDTKKVLADSVATLKAQKRRIKQYWAERTAKEAAGTPLARPPASPARAHALTSYSRKAIPSL